MLKKKELIIASDFGFMNGGAAKIAIQHAILFAKNERYNVTFVCAETTQEFRDYLEGNNVTVKVLNVKAKNKIVFVINYIFNILTFLTFNKFLKTHFNTEDVIVHVHTYVNNLSASIFLACGVRNKRVFLTAHDYFTICPNGAHFNYVLNQNCTFRANSTACIKANCDKRSVFEGLLRRIRFAVERLIFRRYCPEFVSISGVSKLKLTHFGYENTTVLNPIDFSPVNSLLGTDKRNGLLYIGRLDNEKGFYKLLDVCLRSSIPLTVIGDTTSRELLHGEHINYLGWCDADTIQHCIDSSIAVVMPSLWYEAFGLVALEAASRGVPCIMTRQSGAAEHFDSEYADLIIDIEEFEELSNIYKKLQQDNVWSHYSKLAKRAFLSYKEESSLYVEKLSAIYEPVN